jgi:hypothetical protein
VAPLQALERGHLVFELIQVDKNPTGEWKELLSSVCDAHRAGTPVKERGTESSLELSDLGADRRLGNSEAHRRFSELTFLADSYEVLQLVDRRSHSHRL